MISKPKITISQKEDNIQSDITWRSSPNKSFGDLSLLNISDKESPDFATLELNEYLLGSQFDKNISNISFMSDGLSDDECLFDNTWVEANFSSPKTFYVSSIDFGSNYPKKISIQSYLNDQLINEEILDGIDAQTIFSHKPFDNINKIRLTFLESWAPYNYAHLQSWIMGGDIIFDEDDISELKLNESTDPTSNRVEIDKAHIEIIDRHNNFDLLSDININKFISAGNELNISVEITDEDQTKNIFLGEYYISKIAFGLNNLLILECESFLGIMEKIKFMESDMLYSRAQGPLPTVSECIGRIFEKALSELGIDPNKWSDYYEVCEGLDEDLAWGYISPTNCRDALRQVCFIDRLVVYDNRNTKISIKRMDDYQVHTINNDIIVSEPNIELLENISSYKVKVHNYTPGEISEILTLDAPGEYLYDQPSKIESITLIEGTRPEVVGNINGIKIYNNGESFKIRLNGRKFSDQTYDYVRNSNKKDGKQINFSDSKMITVNNFIPLIILKVNYFNSHLMKLKIQYINTEQSTGDHIHIKINDKDFYGVLTYQSLDVAHGMVATAEILGEI